MRQCRVIWVVALCLLCYSLGPGCRPGGVTKPVVKIGLVAPFEGRYRSLGYEVLDAVRWAVQQRNDTGGVAGTLVELVALDDGDSPSSSAFQALEFSVDVDVMGVVGPFSEATVLAAAPVYGEARLAMVTPATCSPLLADRSYGSVFCFGANVDTLGRALVERVPMGARTVLFSLPGGALGEHLSRVVDQVLEGPWSEETLSGLAARPADVYLFDGDVLSASHLLSSMRGAAIDAPLWGGPSLARRQLAHIATDAIQDVCYAVTAPLWTDLSSQSPVATVYQEASGGMPGPWAALAYDAASLLLDALAQEIAESGKPTRAGVIAHLAGYLDGEGAALFSHGERPNAETVFYCYETGHLYPGKLVGP